MRSISLAALADAPRRFSQDNRFYRPLLAPNMAEKTPQGAPDDGAEPVDPVTEAWTDGYARGLADAQEAAARKAAEDEADRQRIELAIDRLDASMQADLRERLRETVAALCEAAIAPAALDPDGLARRVEVAAAMLARADDNRVIRLHPEDLALVAARLPDDWHFEPDPTLDRGAVRVEGSTGGVENGPAQWRAAIAEALRQC